MFKRPQKSESEEDLLRLQKEFFKDKAEKSLEPAAKLIVDRDNSELSPSTDVEKSHVLSHLSNTFEAIHTNIALGEITEKSPNNVVQEPITLKQNKGFPIAKRRNVLRKVQGGSIFSQQIKRQRKENYTSNSKHEDDEQNIPSQNYISGNEKQKIHQENIDIMSNMTEEEILEEREKLMSTLDPAIIAFLKSKRFHTSQKSEEQMDIGIQNKAAENIKTEEIRSLSDILTEPNAEKWINFDKLETNKMAWMKDIDISELEKKKDYEARFDFNGWLLPFKKAEINEKSRILYHHGEEPERPGYTLQELFQLCRSNIVQQKVIALNSIANLLLLESSGIYDNIVNIPLEQIFFVLRFCLDDNTPSVVNASVKAVRNLFYYPIDEACADNLLAFGLCICQPSLAAEQIDEEDNETINDQQLAEKNLVKCLIRTDILKRLSYIISVLKPSIETVTHCLELLIRLSRDSLRIAKLVFNYENLMENIIKFFVPKNVNGSTASMNYGIPLKQSVKLLRILATRDKQIASDQVHKYNIMDSVFFYLSDETFSSNGNGIQLQTEAIHLWIVLINYDLTVDHFAIFQPILLQILNYHIHNTDLDMSTSYTIQYHVGAILSLIAQVATKKFNYILPFITPLQQAFVKWSSQFNLLSQFLCGKLAIISAALRCFTFLIKHADIEFKKKINDCVESIVNSKAFKIITSNIMNGSNILSKCETHKPCKNLITMEAAAWNTFEHIIPILQTNSCLPFLCSLITFIEATDNYQLKLSFLQDDHLLDYLNSVKNSVDFNLSSNWFTRIESTAILNILKISSNVRNNIDTALYFQIAVKCLSIFNSEQKIDAEFVLRNLIFDKNFYSHEILMKNLEINDDGMLTSMNSLNLIFETYKEVLNLTTTSSSFNLCVDIKLGNIIPVDWIYSPIVVLYSNTQQNAQGLSEDKIIFILSNCLRWIYIYETFFSELASLVNPVDKFCRLACVFLASDDAFFVPEIHNLLEQCLKILLKNDGKNLNFDRTVNGVNNFQDFYTQMLEQYQGVSYGDVLFSNFILIPLMQRQNVKYRKLVWSEYGGVTQICNITTEQLVCPLDEFLDPPETDLSLLKCYRKAVAMKSLPDTSVLNIIATFQVDHFISNKK